jgi:hypothetical protein
LEENSELRGAFGSNSSLLLVPESRPNLFARCYIVFAKESYLDLEIFRTYHFCIFMKVINCTACNL